MKRPTVERRSLTRVSPLQALLEAEGIAERSAAVEAARCPLRDDAQRAFRAYFHKQPEEARALASVWASANLPAVVGGKRRQARREADELFQGRAA